MAIAAILAGGAFDLIKHLTAHGTSKDSFQQIKQEFQQLSADLQAGNLSQAQTDFSALQQNLPSSQQASSSALQSNSQSNQSTLTAAVAQLAQDLQSGNLSTARSDFAAVQQDVQQISQQQGAGSTRHHHHRSEGDASSNLSSSQKQAVSALFSQLGQSLQSGNLSAAQQAYSTLPQDFQQFALGNISSNPSSAGSLAGSHLNISA